MRATLAALLAAASCIATAGAQDTIAPPASLIVDGVPPIPADLALQTAPYGEFRPHAMLSWHPLRREMLVRRRLHATYQAHVMTEPGVTPVPITDFADAVTNARYQPAHGEFIVFARAEGGSEVYRLYRQDAAGGTAPLSPEGERAASFSFNRKGDRIVYTTQLVDRNNPERTARTTVHLMDPLNPDSDRVIARFESGGFGGFHFSEDGRRLVFVERKSANESFLWVMDVASGRKRRVTPASAEPVYYGETHFSKDGSGLFTVSDRSGEFRRLAYLPLSGGREKMLTAHLYFIDLATWKELPRPPLVSGVIGGLEWRPKSSEVAFHMSSARSAGDVFSYDVKANRLTRWTNGNNPKVNTSQFAEPRIVKWKTFDAREISGFYYPPAARFTGKRPVIVYIHGGPESQARPGFLGRYNYFLDELGVAMIYPNVRGSAGFGKTFLKLDNGMKREDSVKDIGALLDWIGEQPELDAGRVMVAGGSYGGYMAFACAVHFADRLAGASSNVEDLQAAPRDAGLERSARALYRGRADHRDAEEARHPGVVDLRPGRGARLREEAQCGLPVLHIGGIRPADAAEVARSYLRTQAPNTARASRSPALFACSATSAGTHAGNATSRVSWRPVAVCTSRTCVSRSGEKRLAMRTNDGHSRR